MIVKNLNCKTYEKLIFIVTYKFFIEKHIFPIYFLTIIKYLKQTLYKFYAKRKSKTITFLCTKNLYYIHNFLESFQKYRN